MWVELICQPDLNSMDVHNWNFCNFTGAPSTNPSGKGAVPTGMVSAGVKRQVITVTQNDNGDPLAIFTTVRQNFVVFSGGRHVADAHADLVIEQEIQIVFSVELYFDASFPASQQNSAVSAFQSYNFSTGIDPIAYAVSQAAALGVSPSSFAVVPSYTINAVGTSTLHDDQMKALVAFYNGSAQGTVTLPGSPPDTIENFMRGFGYTLSPIAPDVLIGPPQKPRGNPTNPPTPGDDSQEVDIIPGSDPTNFIQSVLEGQTSAACSAQGFNLKDYKLIVVMAWPEFQIVWRVASINTGCGGSIEFSYPVLQTRITSVWLHASVLEPNSMAAVDVAKVQQAAVSAAISGGVIAVIYADPPAGLAAFNALFWAQLGQLGVMNAVCLVPNLFLVTESPNWS